MLVCSAGPHEPNSQVSLLFWVMGCWFERSEYAAHSAQFKNVKFFAWAKIWVAESLRKILTNHFCNKSPKFRKPRLGSSLPGLCTRDPLLQRCKSGVTGFPESKTTLQPYNYADQSVYGALLFFRQLSFCSLMIMQTTQFLQPYDSADNSVSSVFWVCRQLSFWSLMILHMILL